MKAKIAVIIVNWNGERYLANCIQSVFDQTRKPDRVVVVDNGSTDSSVALLREFGSQITLVCLDSNRGFAAANNVALASLEDYAWVALLNPDAFAEPDWLKQLESAAARNPGYASFASTMVKAADHGVLDSAGDAYHCFGHPSPIGAGAPVASMDAHDREVFSACAGAALYERNALIAAGGFDEHFFCYLEDVDLGFRLRLRGHRCLFVQDARVAHVGSGLTGKRSDFVVYHSSRNLLWVFLKNMPLPLLIVLALPHLAVNVLGTLKYALHRKGLTSLRGRWDGMKGIRRVWQQRQAIQAGRTASTASLLAAMSCLAVGRRG